MLRIEIEGDPVPLARPRYSIRRVYQPKRNVEYRRKIQAAGTCCDERRGANERRTLRGREAISEVQTNGKEFRRRGQPPESNF